METKICNKCSETKPVSEYHKASRNMGGRYHTCKKCRRDIDASYYHSSNKKIKIKARQKAHQFLISQYKKERGCRFCPEKESIALDFHHKDQNKEFNTSNSGKRFGWSRILREIEKCDVVCSNCHRKIHAGIIGL
jgi:hypothetical protein